MNLIRTPELRLSGRSLEKMRVLTVLMEEAEHREVRRAAQSMEAGLALDRRRDRRRRARKATP